MLSITKLQNLKAIHNSLEIPRSSPKVVVNHKTTKFESNSQQQQAQIHFHSSCCQSQNYKIWKQFTTPGQLFPLLNELLSITKLQNLKAIHNPWWALPYSLLVVVNHKTTKFESNSQRFRHCEYRRKSCCQSQNYKIWKQFTTGGGRFSIPTPLLSITKLQNLKAIHNEINKQAIANYVVVNHKTTKFESNSQRYSSVFAPDSSCCQSQNYKIWKQFTTKSCGMSIVP